MDERVLPVARPSWIFRLFAAGTFAILGLFIAVMGQSAAGGGAGLLLLGIGLLCGAVFGYIAVDAARALHSPGLRLTDEGFTFSTHTFAWSDIADLGRVGSVEFGNTHLRIAFVPDAALRWDVRLSVAAGKASCYLPPAHLPLKGFVTDGVPLDTLLNEWLRRALASDSG